MLTIVGLVLVYAGILAFLFCWPTFVAARVVILAATAALGAGGALGAVYWSQLRGHAEMMEFRATHVGAMRQQGKRMVRQDDCKRPSGELFVDECMPGTRLTKPAHEL